MLNPLSHPGGPHLRNLEGSRDKEHNLVGFDLFLSTGGSDQRYQIFFQSVGHLKPRCGCYSLENLNSDLTAPTLPVSNLHATGPIEHPNSEALFRGFPKVKLLHLVESQGATLQQMKAGLKGHCDCLLGWFKCMIDKQRKSQRSKIKLQQPIYFMGVLHGR